MNKDTDDSFTRDIRDLRPLLDARRAVQVPHARHREKRYARQFRLAKTGSWGLVDQGLSSITNLGLSVAIAKTSTLSGFGAYALGYAAYAIVTGIVVNASTIPITIQHGAESLDRFRIQLRTAVSAGAGIGLIAGFLLVAVALLFHSSVRGYLLLFGALMPLLMLQTVWRYIYFALRDPKFAALCDGVWAFFQTVAFIVLILRGNKDPFAYAASWGAAAAIAGLLFSLKLKVWPQIHTFVSHLREYRRLLPNLVGEFLALSGVNQTLPYVLAVVLGITAVAAFKAGQLELGLLNIPLQGLGPLALAYAIREYEKGAQQLRHLLRLCVYGGGVAILLFGLSLSLLIPIKLMRQVIGPNASPAHPLILPLTLMLLGQWIAFVAFIGLRARADVRITFILQALISGVLLVACIAGGTLGHLSGACWAIATTYIVGSGAAWIFHALRLRHAEALRIGAQRAYGQGLEVPTGVTELKNERQ
jgi:O-antigen/teichoic acid export membrane protein